MAGRWLGLALWVALGTCGVSETVAAAPSGRAALPAVIRADEPVDFAAVGDPADAAAAADPDGEAAHAPIGLSAARARILLRSLTIPGWGQATAGHRRAATLFGVAEVGVWASFTAFRIQSQLRRDAYERTARLFAGIDLRGRDEEYRRIIGSYISSDEYNQLVVYREAANLYYDDPELYRQYIAEHSLGGSNTWHWASEDALRRYGAQRKRAQRAGIRANTALAVAIANRLLSAVHAARLDEAPGQPRSWNLEIMPGRGEDALAFTCGVRARF